MNHHGITPESPVPGAQKWPRAGSASEASAYFHGSQALHPSHIVQITVGSLLHHTSIMPASSVLGVHRRQAREGLRGGSFPSQGNPFPGRRPRLARHLHGDNFYEYMATGPCGNAGKCSPHIGEGRLARTCPQWLIRSPSRCGWGGNSNPKRNLSPSDSDGLRFPLRIQLWVLWR